MEQNRESKTQLARIWELGAEGNWHYKAGGERQAVCILGSLCGRYIIRFQLHPKQNSVLQMA